MAEGQDVTDPPESAPNSKSDSVGMPMNGTSDTPITTSATNQLQELGDGRRPRDITYKALRAAGGAKWRDRLPVNVQNKLYDIADLMLQKDIVRSYRDGTLPTNRLVVPEDETVCIPAIWVVDFVGPSQIAAVRKAFKKNNWYFPAYSVLPNLETLDEVRNGVGDQWWWTIAEIANRSSSRKHSAPHRVKLPYEIDAVRVYGWNLGGSLTAIAAYVELTDTAALSVNKEWHAVHDPGLGRHGGRIVAENSRASNYRHTQGARLRLLETARSWFGDVCPGAFAQNSMAQTTIDLLLLKEYDPIAAGDQFLPDTMRSLGLTGPSEGEWITSRSLPGMLLKQVELIASASLEHRQTWALWGNASRIDKEISATPRYGDELEFAIARKVNNNATKILLQVAISDLINLHQRKNAQVRDSAHSRHRKYSLKHVAHLRETFLTSSLDTASTMRDIEAFNSSGAGRQASLIREMSPMVRNSNEEIGFFTPEPADYASDLRVAQNDATNELMVADREYREVLSTVAALGSSIDSFKVQRIAISIAIIALVVGVFTLAVGGLTLWVTAIGAVEACEVIRERFSVFEGMCTPPDQL